MRPRLLGLVLLVAAVMLTLFVVYPRWSLFESANPADLRVGATPSEPSASPPVSDAKLRADDPGIAPIATVPFVAQTPFAPAFEAVVVSEYRGEPVAGAQIRFASWPGFSVNAAGWAVPLSSSEGVALGGPGLVVSWGEGVARPGPWPGCWWLPTSLVAVADRSSDSATSRADGTFRLTIGSSPPTGLLIEAEGHAPAFLALDAERLPAVPVRIPLSPMHRVTLKLQLPDGRDPEDLATGTELFGSYHLATRALLRQGLLLDEVGTAHIDLGNETTLRVQLSSEGFAPVDRWFEFGPDDVTLRVDLTEVPSIRGRVRDAEGKSVADAVVKLDVSSRGLFERGPRRRVTRTDVRGRFRVSMPWKTARISISRRGYVPEERGPVRAGDVLDVTLAAAVHGSISGRAVRTSGEALPGVTVYAASSGVAFETLQTQTDEAGRYRLTGALPGTWAVVLDREQSPQIDASTLFPVSVRREGVVVEAERETMGIDFIVGGGGSVVGTVRGPDGKPDSRARVSLVRPDLMAARHVVLGSRDVTTDGEFRFDEIVPGTYAVSLGLGAAIKMATVREGQAAEVHFGGADASVRGRICDKGSPVAGLAVTVGSVSSDSLRSVADTILSDDQGEFGVAGLETGEVLVHVSDPRRSRAWIFLARAETAAEVQRFDWPEVSVTVTVATSLAGGSLELFLTRLSSQALTFTVPRDHRYITGAQIPAAGRVRIGGLGPGTYELRLPDGQLHQFDLGASDGDLDLTAAR